jgi:nucleoside-diphosphate-sugar epimerase
VGQSPYSASKIGADQMAVAYHRSFELPVAILRPFNTFGPRQSARAIIPTVISQILAGRDPIEVGSLAPQRDFNYVGDTVEGFLGIAQCDAAIGEVVNVGSGQTWTIGETIQRIAAIIGRPVQVRTQEQRMRPDASEVHLLLANTAKAERLWGYRPQVDFDEGLRRTVQWLSDNQHRYRPDEYAV